MAGDWIKMRHDLPEDPAVITIAAELGLTEDEVVGKLLRLWIWADKQTIDGNARGVTVAWLDRHIGVTGFAQAVVNAGWLETNSGGIAVPKFDEHISESAKQRALTARRVARHRNQKGNAAIVISALPREEKRREEKEEPPISPLKLPAGFDTAAVATAVEEWLAYRRKSGKPYKSAQTQITKLLKEHETPERFIAAVEHSIAHGYQGCFGPHGGKTDGTPIGQRGRIRE